MGSHPLVRNNSNQSKRSTIDRKLAFRLGLTALLFAAILALALNRDFYTESMTSAFRSLALASAVIGYGDDPALLVRFALGLDRQPFPGGARLSCDGFSAGVHGRLFVCGLGRSGGLGYSHDLCRR